MTGDSGNLQPTEVATAYEQWLADDVARFLAGDDPFAEEEDSDQDELEAPVDVPAPSPATARGPPPAPAPSVPAELGTPPSHPERTVADERASRCTSSATFPSVHSKLLPAAHSSPSLLLYRRDAIPVGQVATMSKTKQDPTIQATKAAIFAAVPARMQLGELGGTSQVASASAPGPKRVSQALPTHQFAAARGCSSIDILLKRFLPNNQCDPFKRGELISAFIRSWPLPCEGENLRKVQDTIYSVIVKLYADGRVPSTQNVEHALLSQKSEITRSTSISVSASVLQIVARQPAIYAIWSSAKFHTYIMLREKPMFPKAMNVARQMSRARAESSDLETAVKAERRYTGLRSHMIELSSPAPIHTSSESQIIELSPPAQTNQVTSQIMAVLAAAAAASSTQAGVEGSSGTCATWDAYCPKCFEVKWQIPNCGGAFCRGCNVKLLELPTDREGGYAEAADNVDLDANMSETSGQDGKKSYGIDSSERIANIIREHGYTTLMIRNLSMRMRQKHLLKWINESGFQDKYDYCHLPLTFGKGSRTNGVGYAFVNFEVSEDAAQFVMRWHGRRYVGVSRSDTAITITHAEMQGKEANAVNWLRRGCHIRNPGLRPFIKGRCEALEEHERKTAIEKLDASAPPSVPPGLVSNTSSAEMTIGKCDTDFVNSLPPGLVQHVPMTSLAPPGLIARPGRSIGADAEPAGLESQPNMPWPLTLDMMAGFFSPQA